MPVDNEIYNRQADGWWDENHFLHLLKTGINPARFGYFRDILTRRLALDPQTLTTLDVGCGGGILSEEFARLGCQVIGIDPSLASLETARRHAESQSLTIRYQPGTGENIPFEDSSFDLVICCDVLEHVVDLEKTIREVTRVLKPGGILFYDTINRTKEAHKSNIFAAQDFPLTSFFPKDTHTWDKFIQPVELLSVFERAGLENQEMTGLRAGLPDAQISF